MNKVIDFLVNNNGLTKSEASKIYNDAFEVIMRDPYESASPLFYELGLAPGIPDDLAA